MRRLYPAAASRKRSSSAACWRGNSLVARRRVMFQRNGQQTVREVDVEPRMHLGRLLYATRSADRNPSGC